MACMDPVVRRDFHCSNCEEALCLTDHEFYFLVGKVVRCPFCNAEFLLWECCTEQGATFLTVQNLKVPTVRGIRYYYH